MLHGDMHGECEFREVSLLTMTVQALTESDESAFVSRMMKHVMLWGLEIQAIQHMHMLLGLVLQAEGL